MVPALRSKIQHGPTELGSGSVRTAHRCRKEEDLARGRTPRVATVGVAEHSNSAILITLTCGPIFGAATAVWCFFGEEIKKANAERHERLSQQPFIEQRIATQHRERAERIEARRQRFINGED